MRIDALEASAESLTVDQKAQRLLRGDHVSEGVMKMWRGLPVDQYESIIEGKYQSDMLRAGVVFIIDLQHGLCRGNWAVKRPASGLYAAQAHERCLK